MIDMDELGVNLSKVITEDALEELKTTLQGYLVTLAADMTAEEMVVVKYNLDNLINTICTVVYELNIKVAE